MILFGIFLFALHISLLVYINSSYLAQFVGEERVGLLFALGYMAAIVLINLMPQTVRRFGIFRTLMTLLLVDAVALAVFLTVGRGWPVALFFIIYIAAIMAGKLLFDIYLEEFTQPAHAGRVRGLYLLLFNFAVIISPLAVSAILTNNDYWKIFLLSAAALLATLIFAASKLRGIPDLAYSRTPMRALFSAAPRHRNTTRIILSNFLLNFFYAIMIIYTPIYLHQTIGFSWEQIGIIFTIMLLPFILIQWPLGKIADLRLGEKEILTAGFIVAGISTILLSKITTPSVALWAGALLATRLGAAAIEVMNETYFFKKVKAEDAGVISLYRDAEPAAYVAAPLVASGLLTFLGISQIFIVLGALMLSGVLISLSLRDTR